MTFISFLINGSRFLKFDLVLRRRAIWALHGFFGRFENLINHIFNEVGTIVLEDEDSLLDFEEFFWREEEARAATANGLEEFMSLFSITDVHNWTRKFNVAKVAGAFANTITTGAAALTRLNSS